ncbi:hypothetical protein, partial [Peribacillus sp. NPDC056705]|uniref:hypothetical protein n=1 Tax=Peribacillus sp. NPDC056705 TaxID=3345918 RepID=UPI0037490206
LSAKHLSNLAVDGNGGCRIHWLYTGASAYMVISRMGTDAGNPRSSRRISYADGRGPRIQAAGPIPS